MQRPGIFATLHKKISGTSASIEAAPSELQDGLHSEIRKFSAHDNSPMVKRENRNKAVLTQTISGELQLHII